MKARLPAAASAVFLILTVTGIGPCALSSGISGSPSTVTFNNKGDQEKIALSNAGKKVETIAKLSPKVSPESLYKSFQLCENKTLPCTETVECKEAGKGSGEFTATTVAGNVWKAVLKCP